MGNIQGERVNIMDDEKFDKEFDDLFGDLFKNIPTREEVEARKREEEQKRKSFLECQKFLGAYAKTLPGAEKIREDNPAVEIRCGIKENGESYMRTITREEKLDEFLKELDELFKSNDSNNPDKGHYHR